MNPDWFHLQHFLPKKCGPRGGTTKPARVKEISVLEATRSGLVIRFSFGLRSLETSKWGVSSSLGSIHNPQETDSLLLGGSANQLKSLVWTPQMVPTRRSRCSNSGSVSCMDSHPYGPVGLLTWFETWFVSFEAPPKRLVCWFSLFFDQPKLRPCPPKAKSSPFPHGH